MAQVFYASPTDTLTHPNGAIGHRPGGPMDCLGPYAKVRNCPIDGTTLRLTCYATAYADTFFSVPACTRYRGKHIRGFFTTDEQGVKFCPMDSHKHLLTTPPKPLYWLCGSSDDLGDAVPYGTKAAACAAFRDTANELARYGQAYEAAIHIAPSRVTVVEYPDYVLALGPHGGLWCDKA